MNSKLDLTYYIELQNRAEEVFKFVHCHPNNFQTFSIKIENLFVDTCAFFDSLCQAHIIDEEKKGTTIDGGTQKKIKKNDHLNMVDYRNFFETNHNLSQKSLNLNPSDEIYFGNPFHYFHAAKTLGGEKITPFVSWSSSSHSSLDWWSSYTSLKHHRLANYQKATLKGLIDALGAVFILLTVRHEDYFKKAAVGIEYYNLFFPEYWAKSGAVTQMVITWR